MRVLDQLTIDYPAHGDHFGALRNESYKENDVPDWAVTQASIEQMNEMLSNMDKRPPGGRIGRGIDYRLHGERCYDTGIVQCPESRS